MVVKGAGVAIFCATFCLRTSFVIQVAARPTWRPSKKVSFFWKLGPNAQYKKGPSILFAILSKHSGIQSIKIRKVNT